ncbi:hypothetical protein GS934_04065 [Rhodococcus hoagii]|nr:hypothetical protein [Prescottella equi]NKZ87106.1 hypothetical protein [Prescottella equi]
MQYSFATAGKHSITAAFAGNAGFSNSSAAAQIRHRDHPRASRRPDHHDAHRACNHGQGHGDHTHTPPSPRQRVRQRPVPGRPDTDRRTGHSHERNRFRAALVRDVR